MRREHKEFLLLNLVLLLLVLPGSMAVASFDAPYGFTRDLTTWLCSYVGFSPIVFGYLVWKRESLGLKTVPLFAGSILALAYITHLVQQPLFEGYRASGYNPGFGTYLVGCLLTAGLSLLIIPFAFLNPGGTIFHDPILVMAELVLISMIAVFGWRLYWKKGERE
jgi:hypothetical protein